MGDFGFKYALFFNLFDYTILEVAHGNPGYAHGPVHSWEERSCVVTSPRGAAQRREGSAFKFWPLPVFRFAFSFIAFFIMCETLIVGRFGLSATMIAGKSVDDGALDWNSMQQSSVQ